MLENLHRLGDPSSVHVYWRRFRRRRLDVLTLDRIILYGDFLVALWQFYHALLSLFLVDVLNQLTH
jgi:hypothetical protein